MGDGTPNSLPRDLTIDAAADKVAVALYQALQNAAYPVNSLTMQLAHNKGKGIRTSLLLAAAANENGMVSQDSVVLCTSVELLHLASLVHDDVIDDAQTRRGQTALHKTFSIKQAVLCGDYLMCVAMNNLQQLSEEAHSVIKTEESILYIFAAGMEKICLGELLQMQNNKNISLGIKGYLRIISYKTAFLFYMAALAGAASSGCPEEEIRRIARFGKQLGLLFQIIDDYKDYEFTSEQAGKPVLQDLASGVVTLPLILGMAQDKTIGPMALEAFADVKTVSLLANRVRKAGGTKGSLAIAHRYVSKANQTLRGLPEYKRMQLRPLLEKALRNVGATPVLE